MKYLLWLFRILCDFTGHDLFYDDGFAICRSCKYIRRSL